MPSKKAASGAPVAASAPPPQPAAQAAPASTSTPTLATQPNVGRVAVKPETAWPLPEIPAHTIDNTQSLLRFVILAFITGAAVASRLFAVIRFESVIHEFDPWFN